MRIAVIGPVGLPPAGGGVTRHSFELYTRLSERGHEVTIFGRSRLVGRTQSSTLDTGRLFVRGMRTIPVPGWETLSYGLQSTLKAAREPFDLVHYQGVAGATFARLAKSKKPVALTVHSLDWTHSKWGPGARRLLIRTEQTAVRSAGLVIAVSRFLRDELLQRYPGLEIHHIPNGFTPLPQPHPRALSELGVTRPYLLFAGRIVPEKGLHALLEAHQALPGPAPELLVAGTAGRRSAYLRRLTAAAGPGVRFLGQQSTAKLAALLQNAMMLVAPSVREGFNLTVLEAASVGCPVLASDIPPHREILGPEGFFFEAGSPASLRYALISAIASDDDLKIRAEKVRERVQSPEHDWDRIADRTLELLVRLVNP